MHGRKNIKMRIVSFSFGKSLCRNDIIRGFQNFTLISQRSVWRWKVVKSNYLFFKRDSCYDKVQFILGAKILKIMYKSSNCKNIEQHINLLKPRRHFTFHQTLDEILRSAHGKCLCILYQSQGKR